MISKVKLLSFALVITACSISSVYANNIMTVENRLPKKINVIARFGGTCRISNFIVEPHSTRRDNAYGCCLINRAIEIYELNDNGTRTNRACLFHYRTTGASLGCSDNHFVVLDAGSKIVAVRAEDVR